MNDELIEKIQSILDQAVKKNEIPGASLLVEEKGKEVCFLKSGYQDVEQKKKIQRNSIFRLYSMSKPITAACTMILLENGVIDLQEPVSSFFPSYKKQMVAATEGKWELAQREITIRDLLNMTAGLMYPWNGNPAGAYANDVFFELEKRLITENPMTTAEFAKRLGEGPLAFHPGTSWQYSSCADVLGAVLEKAAGIPFSKLLQKVLFEPLEMKDTGFYVPEEKQSRFMKVYSCESDSMQIYKGNHLGILNAMNRKPAFESGGAGLVSTVDDYTKFARMLLQGGSYKGQTIIENRTVHFMTQGALNAAQQKELQKNAFAMTGYTYGNLVRVLQNESMAYHFGNALEYGWDGWLGCCFINDPVVRRSIVFMTQRTDAGEPPVMRKIKNVIYAKEYENG